MKTSNFISFGLFITSCYCSDAFFRTSSLLLEKLNKFHNKEAIENEDISYSEIDSFEAANGGLMASIPGELNFNILSYLDINSFKFQLQTSRCSRKFCNNFIKLKIITFSPYLLFKNVFVNYAMFNFINTNFAFVKDINDPQVYDALEIANIRFIRKEFFSNYLSENLNYLFLSFMHELIYGPEESIPASPEHWKILFVEKIMKYKLPRSIEYYMVLVNEESKKKKFATWRSKDLQEKITNIIEFLNSKLYDSTDLLRFYREFSIIPDLITVANELIKTVYCSLQELIINETNTTKLIVLLNRYSFSQSVLDRFPADSIQLKQITQLALKESRKMKALYKKIKFYNVDATALEYLWTLDSLNPFNLSHFLRLTGCIQSAFFELATCYNPNIAQINSLQQIIRSGIYNFESIKCRSKSLIFQHFRIRSSSNVISRIILNEAPTSINMFVCDDFNNNFLPSLITTFIHETRLYYIFDSISNNKIKIYLENLKTDDPFPTLFILLGTNLNIIVLLNSFRPFIVNRFNLKKRYKFDVSITDILSLRTNQISEMFYALRGRTLTFKQIISFINIIGFMDLFTSDLNYFVRQGDGENEINLTPPISIKQFLYSGELKPENKPSSDNYCLIN